MELEAFGGHGSHSIIEHLAGCIRIFDLVSGQSEKKCKRIGGKINRRNQISRRSYVECKQISK